MLKAFKMRLNCFFLYIYLSVVFYKKEGMNKIFKIGVLGVIVYLGLLLYSKIRAIKSLVLTLGVPRNLRFDNSYFKYSQEIKVFNPSDVDVVITQLNLEAFVKNNKLGNCYLLKSQEIKQTK